MRVGTVETWIGSRTTPLEACARFMCTATSDSAMPQLLTVTAALLRLGPERAMCALAGMLRQPQAGGSGSGKTVLYYQPVAGPPDG
jgi:hypothetical protein